jgi:O-antigen ligase
MPILIAKSENLTIIRYLALILIILHLPGFTLVYLNDSLSSILSYLSYGLIILYVLLNGKTGNNYMMLFLGLSYFLISSLANQEYMPVFSLFIIIVIKYFIIILGGYELMKRTNKNEMVIFMLLGALSILANIFVFENPRGDNGRYSGFYLDPNNAGLICLIGFAITYSIDKKFRLILRLIFTILGLFTFSRTFIITWIIINLLSIRLDFKNAKMLLIGFGILSTLLIYNEFLPSKNVRLEQLGAMIGGNEKKASKLESDSRWDTWSRYFDALQDKPIFGNGYQAFGGNGVAPPVGVHNTYLLIWGESGIIPLMLFIGYLTFLFKKSFNQFKKSPHILMMLIALSLFLLTNHNFFTTDYSILILLWIHLQIQEKENDEQILVQPNPVLV